MPISPNTALARTSIIPFRCICRSVLRYLGYKNGDLPESERAANETLAIPIYPELRPEQQEYVVSTIADFFNA